MHTQNVEAIVLKTYNVGEADRFCILLTRELGRLAARARGVRKLTSRMGGALLPFQHVQIELKEFGNDGWMVTGAGRKFAGFRFQVSCFDNNEDNQQSEINNQKYLLQAFVQAQQGTELLLKLLHDHQPLPEVFDATLQFLRLCGENYPRLVLSFTFHLLHLLGHLPETSNDAYFEQCSQEERNFATQAREGRYAQFFVRQEPAFVEPTSLRLRGPGVMAGRHSWSTNSRLQAIADALIADQISSPLRVAGVASAIA